MFRSWDDATIGYVDALRADEDLRAEFENAADLGVAEQVGKLLRITNRQAQRIADLELSVQLLTQLLVERGGLDLAAFQARYQAVQASQVSHQAAKAAAQNQVQCAACGKSVDRRNSFVTSRGTVCGGCHSG